MQLMLAIAATVGVPLRVTVAKVAKVAHVCFLRPPFSPPPARPEFQRQFNHSLMCQALSN